jgi:hypothetical protein
LTDSTEIKKPPTPPIDPTLTDEKKEALEGIKTEITEEKKKRNRRSPAQIEAERKAAAVDANADFGKSIAGLGGMFMEMAVMRLPNPVPLSAQEKENFDKVFNDVAMKYANYLGNYKEESALILVTGMILLPRLDLFGKKKKENKPQNPTEIVIPTLIKRDPTQDRTE